MYEILHNLVSQLCELIPDCQPEQVELTFRGSSPHWYCSVLPTFSKPTRGGRKVVRKGFEGVGETPELAALDVMRQVLAFKHPELVAQSRGLRRAAEELQALKAVSAPERLARMLARIEREIVEVEAQLEPILTRPEAV